MARFRISAPAREDLASILAASMERWGDRGRARYAALLTTAMQAIARDPMGPNTRDRDELHRGVRSFHLRSVRKAHAVHAPVHVVFFRSVGDIVEIVRVLHERMEPSVHVTTPKPRTSRRRSK